MTLPIEPLVQAALTERAISQWIAESFPSGDFTNWLAVSLKRGKPLPDRPASEDILPKILQEAANLPVSYREMLMEYLQ